MPGFDLSIPVATYVDTVEEAQKWVNRYRETRKVNGRRGGLGLDSETTGLDRLYSRIVIWSISDHESRLCLPITMLPVFKELLEDPETNIDGTNIAFDAHMFLNHGVDLSKAGEWRDTSNMSWLRNENMIGRHGLKETTKELTGRNTPTFEEVFGKLPPKREGAHQKTSGDLIYEALRDPDRRIKAIDYASLDAFNSTTLRRIFDDILSKEIISGTGRTLYDHFYEFEVPFTKILWKMEDRGFTIDKGYLMSLEPGMKKDLEGIQKRFSQLAEKLVNLRSTLQMREFFFGLLKKEPVGWTKGGASGIKQPSTDSDALEIWAGQGCQYAQWALEHRSIAKALDTYVKGIPENLDKKYRVHTHINGRLVTGRLATTEPSLLNIPRPGEDPYVIREAFVAAEDCTLTVADYEQLEMRIMAHMSKDTKMVKAINDGVDLHCFTVSEIYDYPYGLVVEAVKAVKLSKKGKLGREPTEEEAYLVLLRQAAKATGFGILYGIGGEHLAANLTKDLKRLFTKEEGFDLIHKYFNVFPGVKAYIDEVKRTVWKTGRVQTILGRFRRFGDLRGMSKKDASQCERQAVNSIIQGSAADIAKVVMIRAEGDQELKDAGAKLLLQIHDELIFEGPTKNKDRIKKRVKEIMEDPFDGWRLLVPLPVEANDGYSWASSK